MNIKTCLVFLLLLIAVALGGNSFGDTATTLLADAAQAKQWVVAEQLLSSGSDVRAAQVDGMTALHWAVYHQHLPFVRQLISAKANVNAATRYDVTPLSIACSMADDQIVQQLLNAGADANAALPGGETPLMIAARTGNANAIRHLLAADAETDATERRGQTALMWAAAEGNLAAVDALIEGGANLNKSSKADFTPMLFAAREGRINVVARLIEAGVDVNAEMKPKGSGNRVPRDGTSALILAVESGHFELAMFLVQNGADPNDQRCGVAPLHIVSWVRKPNRGEGSDGDPPPRGSGNLTSLQFVRAIVDAGADVNLKLKNGKAGKAVMNRKGATPMLMAGKTADVPLMRLLIELGADPLQGNVDGCTPLMAAAGVGVRAVDEEAGTQYEVIEAIEFLIAHGADVNTVDKNKETAMHGAAYRNFPLVVECLAKHGADPQSWNHKNKHGWTPVMIAQGNRPGSFKPSPVTVNALRAAMAVKQ